MATTPKKSTPVKKTNAASAKKTVSDKTAAKTVKAPTVKKVTPAAAHKEKVIAVEIPAQEEIIKADLKPSYDFALPKADGKYFFATGRRKTSVANVRLFFGKGDSQINKKTFLAYFGAAFTPVAMKPLQLTGLESQVYVWINANGGGVHSQAQAVAHGIAQAIVKSTPDFRKVLKKNSMLTRDSRMKERKKPGLKRARRGPQWAKR